MDKAKKFGVSKICVCVGGGGCMVPMAYTSVDNLAMVTV